MIDALYRWLPILFGCHCRRDRSFFWRGRQFPLCARCTGELAGILLAIPVCCFHLPSVPPALALLLPLCLDGAAQALTRYESRNSLRFVTGLLFGFGLLVLAVRSVLAAAGLGYGIGRAWRT